MVTLEKNKRQRSHFKRKLKDKSESGAGLKSLYKKNKQQPTTTKHVFLKNPLEIDFFLQVAQFISEILGEIIQYAKGQGTMAEKKRRKKVFTLLLCIQVSLHAK